MPTTVAAGLLALVGLFDVVGTIASGWLTDRVDPRLLLLAYYVLRGFSLALLPVLFGPQVQPSMLAFIIFYGLDWVATIPPTMALCREIFGAAAPVVFGWVFAAPPGRRGADGAGRRHRARPARRLRPGLVRRRWAVPGRRPAVAAGPARRVPVRV